MKPIRGLVHRLLLAGGLLGASVLAHAGLWQLPDEFVDEYGTRARLNHWMGAQTVVSMEYTACKFVCSSNWRKLLEIQAEADRRQLPLRFLIVSLDPAHDTPAAWRDYRRVRGLARENWHFVTGSRSATDRVVQALGVRWWYFDQAIMHDLRLLRLDASGQMRALLTDFNDPPARFMPP